VKIQQSEIEELQAKLTTQTVELTSLSKAKARLQTAYDNKSQRLSDSELACGDLRRQLEADRISHRSERSRYEAEVERYERQLAEQRALVSALEEDYDKIQLESKQMVEEADQRAEAAEAAVKGLEENLKTMKSVAEMLGADRRSLETADGNNEPPSFGLPGASFALKNTGKTYAEIYADYIRVHTDLNLANAEVKRLHASLEEFLRSYNEKVSRTQVDGSSKATGFKHTASADPYHR
jgi:hypothetical protein